MAHDPPREGRLLQSTNQLLFSLTCTCLRHLWSRGTPATCHPWALQAARGTATACMGQTSFMIAFQAASRVFNFIAWEDGRKFIFVLGSARGVLKLLMF